MARALAERRNEKTAGPRFTWISRDMGARVDLADKEALYQAMDEPG